MQNNNPFNKSIYEHFKVESDAVVWQDSELLKGTDLGKSGIRYGAFSQMLQNTSYLPTEYILPKIEIHYRDTLPKTMQSAELRYIEEPLEALRLSKMHWGYYFYLGGGLSTVDNAPFVRARNRASSILRMSMINDVVEKISGDEKTNLHILDFACNWGGMAVDMALRGFSNVTAFDLKKENIQRAKALASFMKATNVVFEKQDVYKLPVRYSNGFDVVYNLGLLYHVTDPVRLAQITYQLTRKFAVFDTLAHKEPFSGYIQAYVSDDAIKRPGMGAQQIELHPTYRGLVDIIHFSGFTKLVEVVPIIGDDYPERERDAYFNGLRRTIIAFK